MWNASLVIVNLTLVKRHLFLSLIFVRVESFEMWCWRRMEKISWTDHVRNEEVLLRVNEQRNKKTEG